MRFNFHRFISILSVIILPTISFVTQAEEVRLVCPYTLDASLIVSINQETNTNSVTTKENNGNETTAQAALVTSEPNYVLGYQDPMLNRRKSTSSYILTQLSINRSNGTFYQERFIRYQNGKITRISDPTVGLNPCRKAEDVKPLF